MAGFYVLNVPEFVPILEAAITTARCHAHPLRAGYRFVEFDGEVELFRKDTGVSEAVWFGCLTGGLDGKIAAFTSDRLKLVATNEPILPAQ